MEIISCKRCSTIFTKISRDLCKNCIEEENRAFDRITDYLKKNRLSDLSEISGSTGIPEDLIQAYVGSGKAENEFGKSMISYKCNMCGDKISSGMVCKDCDRNLSHSISDLKSTIDSLKRNRLGGHKKDNVLISGSDKKKK